MNEYIKQVTRELSLPKRQKDEILRDLEEAFASAKEHGERDEEVIARLGTPKEFADNMREQLGVSGKVNKKKLAAILSTVLAVVIILTVLTIAYAPAIFQRGNPLPYLKAARVLRFAELENVKDDTRAGAVYMTRVSSDSSQIIWHLSEEYGMNFVEQAGSGYIFERSGLKIVVSTETLWGKYIVWDVPAIQTVEMQYQYFNYTREGLLLEFGGCTPGEVHAQLGEPDGTLSGLYGDVYLHNGVRLIFYYDYYEQEDVFRVSEILTEEIIPEAPDESDMTNEV